jgi:outer membrane lipopolysaccharide assembly protein LptE/RlpB
MVDVVHDRLSYASFVHRFDGDTMKTGKLILLLATFVTSGCGYRLAGLQGNDGTGRTIAVPTFANKSTGYRIEQRISEAVRKELARRTRYTVTSEAAGDVVVSGEVLNYNNTSPTVFNDQGRAAQYAIAVELKILVTDTASGKELFRNDQMTFRDSFQLSQNPADFVPEDPAAIDRLASRFASSLVAALLHNNQ